MEFETISFGGLGDSVIVSLKLKQLLEDESIEHINHLFVESNPKTLDWIKEYMIYTWKSVKISFNFECDPNYESHYKSGKWKNRNALNTSWHGKYHFPEPDDIKIKSENSLVDTEYHKPYDICIQASAGAKSNRNWKFNPISLKKLLESKGYIVALVGTDDKFRDDNDPLNFCRSNVSLTTSLIAARSSKVFIGLSGFLTYDTLCHKIKNIHLKESDDHNSHYIHPEWNDHRYEIEFGSMKEIIEGLEYWGCNV